VDADYLAPTSTVAVARDRLDVVMAEACMVMETWHGAEANARTRAFAAAWRAMSELISGSEEQDGRIAIRETGGEHRLREIVVTAVKVIGELRAKEREEVLLVGERPFVHLQGVLGHLQADLRGRDSLVDLADLVVVHADLVLPAGAAAGIARLQSRGLPGDLEELRGVGEQVLPRLRRTSGLEPAILHCEGRAELRRV
jgi:hypothetical protein